MSVQGRSRESTRDLLFGEIALVRKLGVWYNHDMKIVKVLFPLVALCCWTAVSAAALAAEDGRAVQDVPYAALSARLHADGQILEL